MIVAKVRCPQCEAISKAGTRYCPNCGGSLEGVNAVEGKSGLSKKGIIAIIAIVAAVAAIAIAIVLVIPNLNPKGKYETLVDQGKIAEADALYNERIASDDSLAKEFEEEQNYKIQEIYDKYVSEELTYEEATEKIAIYKQADATKTKASSIQNDVDKLKKSRDAFNAGQEAEASGEVEKAISKYKLVIETDDNFDKAQEKIKELNAKWRNDLILEASEHAANKQYKDAISAINKVIAKEGSDDELSALLESYKKLKAEQYVKVECVGKSVTPKNTAQWIFSNYVNFVFEITNNSDKDIKGVEGILTANDLFGKEIISIGCDFTGQIIKVGTTYTESDLSLECNEFIDSNMQLYNTDFSDLIFVYEVTSIVYADGSKVVPE